jgi:hypothetical protein
MISDACHKRQTLDFNLTQAKTLIQDRITRPGFSGSVATEEWIEEQHYAKIGQPVVRHGFSWHSSFRE